MHTVHCIPAKAYGETCVIQHFNTLILINKAILLGTVAILKHAKGHSVSEKSPNLLSSSPILDFECQTRDFLLNVYLRSP